KAQCETLNVMGCQDLYTGTAIIKGLGGAPVKVEIWYGQTETKTLKRATLPGIQVSGGQETEVIDMVHHAVLYHFPSAESLKQGLIVEVEKGNTPGARTAFVSETGWFLYTKNIREAMITAGPEGAAVRETEAGEETIMSGNASLDHPSEVVFHKGDVSTPAFFAWSVEYPTSDQGIAGGTFSITKGDPGVDWQVKKIDDPKSPYKTEYLLNCRLDAAEELKKGNKAMKDLLGVDVDDLANMLNPTNPQKDMAGASGWQTITVRILSPYGQ
ncbi:MAG TPA: hypothetical protein VFZ78_00750, partial [Flavisolibacter sp.]